MIYDLCAEDTLPDASEQKQKRKRKSENGESQATHCFSSNPQLLADDITPNTKTSAGQTSCSQTVRSLHCWMGFGISALRDYGWLDEASAAENF